MGQPQGPAGLPGLWGRAAAVEPGPGAAQCRAAGHRLLPGSPARPAATLRWLPVPLQGKEEPAVPYHHLYEQQFLKGDIIPPGVSHYKLLHLGGHAHL